MGRLSLTPASDFPSGKQNKNVRSWRGEHLFRATAAAQSIGHEGRDGGSFLAPRVFGRKHGENPLNTGPHWQLPASPPGQRLFRPKPPTFLVPAPPSLIRSMPSGPTSTKRSPAMD